MSEQDASWCFIEQKKRPWSWDGHRELDVLTKNVRQGPRLQGPQLKGPELQGPRLQDGSHVPEELVERMEKTMNAAVVLKYGGSNELDQPPTIYRVPEVLKQSCKQAFLPVAVELGLFAHHYRWTGSEHAIQHYKWCCVRKLIGRHHLLQEPERTPARLRRCLDALESLEPLIRSSYHPRQQSYKVSSQELMCNMLLDGCFILHRLLKYARIDRREAFPASSISVSKRKMMTTGPSCSGGVGCGGLSPVICCCSRTRSRSSSCRSFSRSSGRTLLRAATYSWLAHCASFDPSGHRGCNPPTSPAMRCTTSCTSSSAPSDSRKKKLQK